MDFTLTEEQRALQAAAREFARGEMMTVAEATEAERRAALTGLGQAVCRDGVPRRQRGDRVRGTRARQCGRFPGARGVRQDLVCGGLSDLRVGGGGRCTRWRTSRTRR